MLASIFDTSGTVVTVDGTVAKSLIVITLGISFVGPESFPFHLYVSDATDFLDLTYVFLLACHYKV